MSDRRDYMRQWHAAHPKRKAEYSRRYRRKLTRPRDKQRQRELALMRRRRAFSKEPDVERIVQRMAKRGCPVSRPDAREILCEYGPHYPLHRGLSHAGTLWVRRQKDKGSPEPHSRLVMEAWEIKEFRRDS